MMQKKSSGTVISVRNLSPELARILRERARKERTSLNRAVIALLEQATGTSRAGSTAQRRDLSRLAGTWSRAEADRFDKDLAQQRAIEQELWR